MGSRSLEYNGNLWGWGRSYWFSETMGTSANSAKVKGPVVGVANTHGPDAPVDPLLTAPDHEELTWIGFATAKPPFILPYSIG